jgi:ABC-type antimicrobial peptide transport system permease subunit
VLVTLIGGIMGAAVAHIGATRIFTCVEPAFDAMCAGGYPIVALAWGVAIGLVVGLVVGLLLSRRASSS